MGTFFAAPLRSHGRRTGSPESPRPKEGLEQRAVTVRAREHVAGVLAWELTARCGCAGAPDAAP